MTDYERKLLDPQWLEFRAAYMGRLKRAAGEDGAALCADCGEEGPKDGLQVHHRRYRMNLEPWDYPDEDLLLLCADCHKYVHKTEARALAFVISLRPHECNEFNDWMEEMEEARSGGIAKIALARSKNAARDANHTF